MGCDMRKVYLAGAITHVADPQTWRTEAIRLLALYRLEGVDPLKWEAKDFTPDEIIALDYKLILDSTAVLVDCSTPSWGTAMELAFAKQMAKPVFGWNCSAKMSPWLIHHLHTSCVSLDVAIEHLNGWVKKYG